MTIRLQEAVLGVPWFVLREKSIVPLSSAYTADESGDYLVPVVEGLSFLTVLNRPDCAREFKIRTATTNRGLVLQQVMSLQDFLAFLERNSMDGSCLGSLLDPEVILHTPEEPMIPKEVHKPDAAEVKSAASALATSFVSKKLAAVDNSAVPG